MRETVGMAQCALLSLAAFLPLLAYGDRLSAGLALAISLACPAVWLLFLLWSSGGGRGLVQMAKRRAAWSRPALGLDGQPAGVPAEG